MISEKQKKILSFPYSGYDALICDGAVRSGKTSIMMWGFVRWAMDTFDGMRFGVCGKTVDSACKNIVVPFISMTRTKELYSTKWRRADKVLEVRKGGRTNLFEVFGGKDESSAALIQGRTLAGVLLDEVVLMPRSFVEQALTRCSVEGAKIWFSCNPGSPDHWFYQEWIQQKDKHNAYYMHFEMADNPSLSAKTLARYQSMFTGVFYERYVLGKWTKAEGLIYPMYDSAIAAVPEGKPEQVVISIDYGTQNPLAALMWEKHGDTWYAVKGYYYSGRKTGVQKTDSEYGEDIDAFAADVIAKREEAFEKTGRIQEKIKVIVDPSAASFIALLRKKGWCKVIPADNDVSNGIRETATALQNGYIKISPAIPEWKQEASGYVWDEKQDDKPVKEDDHLMDAMRYFVKTEHVLKRGVKYKPLWM